MLLQKSSESNRYKYQVYCEEEKEENREQIKKNMLEYIRKNPDSKILNYKSYIITHSPVSNFDLDIPNFWIAATTNISHTLTEQDIKNYKGSFVKEIETYTKEEIFDQFKDLILTIFKMRKDKRQCNGVKESDIRIFLNGKLSKDKLCQYFPALEKIYISELREQSKICYNYDEDENTFYTLLGEEIGEVPYKNLIMYKKGNITYCFTVTEIEGFANGLNPYTREKIPAEVFDMARKRKKYNSWLIPGKNYEKIAEELAKFDVKFSQKKLYSDLYNYMIHVEQIYPIDEATYLAKSPETIKRQFRDYVNQEITENLLPLPEIARILGSSPENIHLEIVGGLLKILKARDDGNLKSRILLIKQVGLF